MISRFAFALAAVLTTPLVAGAAACCGGGLPVPALVLGDENANLSTTISEANIKTDVTSGGIWEHRQIPEDSQILRIDSAHIIADRWQVGGSLPIMRRARGDDQSTGLGDVAVNGGYEFLPEWEYSPWKPRGVAYLQLTLPTGRSIYEAADIDQLDSRGRGFWALGTGFTLTKIRGKNDGILLFDIHRSFTKIARGTVAGDLTLTPGWGGSLTLGAGHTFGDVRLGASLAWTYEDAVLINGADLPDGSLYRYATASVSAIYSPSRAWSASLAYSDQTLFGEPENTPLAKSVLVSYQHRWPR